MFTGKDIPDLSTGSSGNNQADGKIHFGVLITKRMKAILHWVQDFYCISGETTIIETNGAMFIEQLDTTLYRAYIPKKLIDQSDTKAKEASMGPLEFENKWK